MRKIVFVALGSNLGHSANILSDATKQLQLLSASPTLKSSVWKTSPVNCPPGSPAFLNAVVGIEPLSDETPASLLQKLQSLEKEFGRRAKVVMNEPRPLDLDLLTFGDVISTDPHLTIPHPRAHLRRFVLTPWTEIAPDYVIPGGNKTVGQLLETLHSDEIVERTGPL